MVGIAASALVDAALTLEIETGDSGRRTDIVVEEIADAQTAAVAACPAIGQNGIADERGDSSVDFEN